MTTVKRNPQGAYYDSVVLMNPGAASGSPVIDAGAIMATSQSRSAGRE
jgi:hypothetical protein